MNPRSGSPAVPDIYDVAIVGGGLVGASLASALAPLGYRVLVLERVPPRASAQPSYDDRTLALSYSSHRILQGLDLWPGLESSATAIRQIIVTELARPGRVVLKASEMGLAAFGYVVEARQFGANVLARLEVLESVDVCCPAAVSGLEIKDDCAVLTVESEQGLLQRQARLVVAADGAASSVRSLLNIPVQERDYGQTAVICNLTPESHHKGRAFERLTPTGPFAVLPHAGDRCGLVWSVESAQAERLLELPEEDFIHQAQARFGNELGEFRKIGRRSAYPLKLVRAEQDVAPRTIVLGNAAHTIHPVGAQGFNLGLRDVAVLAELLAGNAGADPGLGSILKAYSDWRRPDQDSTVAWSDGMTRLFANASPVAGFVRTAGLFAHALIPPMRRRLASSAMGYRGRVPKLALGERLSRAGQAGPGGSA